MKGAHASVLSLHTYSHVPDLGPGQRSQLLQEGAERLRPLLWELLHRSGQRVLHLSQAEAGT